MRRPRLPLGLIAPIALVVLVTALGTLQYRWVGQVSERERDQLRQSLDRRAREFASDFDREISRAFEILKPESGPIETEGERFARQFDEWQSASAFPAMVKTAYLARADKNDIALSRFDPVTRTFEPTAWPESLTSVRDRLVAAEARAAALPASSDVLTLSTTPVMADVPAIVIPEVHPTPSIERRRVPAPETAAMNVMVTALPRGRTNQIVLELDRAFITTRMLPALAERHFPETGADRFRMSVVNTAASPLFARGVSPDRPIDPAHADAAAPFFNLRLEMIRTLFAGPITGFSSNGTASWTTDRGSTTPPAAVALRTKPADAMVVAATSAPTPGRSGQFSMVIEQSAKTIATNDITIAATGWTLLLQHSAGSLDAAVAEARRRNLFLSFGILAVLAASAGLVMVNARRSERLAAQQMDFVATVSHELRTPLAVIRSAAQNLSAGVINDTAQAKRYGDLIESEGRRLTDMVEQVLEFAGVSDARLRPPPRAVDAAAVVRDVVSASSSLPDAAGVTFDVRVEPGVPPALADEDALRRALHNLIGNALKYGSAGRWVGVSVDRGRGQESGFVVVSVADRGRGIPSDELSRVFEPFYRGRYAVGQQIHGNGLGLSLVKRIVEALGGRVDVKSAPDQGSTFSLLLPAAGPAAAEPASALGATLSADSPGRSGQPI